MHERAAAPTPPEASRTWDAGEAEQTVSPPVHVPLVLPARVFREQEEGSPETAHGPSVTHFLLPGRCSRTPESHSGPAGPVCAHPLDKMP